MSDDHKDTLPAPHPDTPEWAVQHYNLMLRVYNEVVETRRHVDSELLLLRAEIAGIDRRLKIVEEYNKPLNGEGGPG